MQSNELQVNGGHDFPQSTACGPVLMCLRMLFASFGCQGTVLALLELALHQDPQTVFSRGAP